MKYIDLFAGIGGFRYALDNVGMKCVFTSEIDKVPSEMYKLLHGDEEIAGDIMEIEAQDIPEHDLLVGGFPCFSEGTLITTSEGLKTIENVRKGDYVLTHTNTFKEVVVPMIKHKKGIYELRVQGSPSTHITEEHPVYVREMSRRWNNKTRKTERIWSEPKWVEAKDLEKGTHFVGMSENTESSNPHDITHEEAWLIGRYVADGYVRDNHRKGRGDSCNNQVVFCVGKMKIDEFKGNVKDYYLGISEERTAYKCRIINKRLMDLCIEAGRGSENKRVPGFILDLPVDTLEKFLDGYTSGDGSIRDGQYRATTVSRELAYGLGQVAQKIYNTPYSIEYTKRPKTTVIEGRTVNQRDTWTINFRKENRKQQNGVYIDGMLWMPVRSLVYDETFDGYVYNFEVEGDNSYVANNLTVHNCQGFSQNGTKLGFKYKTGNLFFEAWRIAKEKRPKYILMENVVGLLTNDKKNTITTMVKYLSDIGYGVDFTVLESTDFGLPQARRRVFIVGVLGEWDDKWEIVDAKLINSIKEIIIEKQPNIKTLNFPYPVGTEQCRTLRDFLEDDHNMPYLNIEGFITQIDEHRYRIKDGKKIGYTEFDAVPYETTIDYTFPKSKTRRGRNKEGVTKTLDQAVEVAVYDGIGFRRITPREVFRLQGFPEESYDILANANFSVNQLYARPSRSVSIPIVEAIGEALLQYDKNNKSSKDIKK